MRCCQCGATPADGRLGATLAGYEGREYCILHHPDGKKNAEEFGRCLDERFPAKEGTRIIKKVVFPESFSVRLAGNVVVVRESRAERLDFVEGDGQTYLGLHLDEVVADRVELVTADSVGGVPLVDHERPSLVSIDHREIASLHCPSVNVLEIGRSKFGEMCIGCIISRFRMDYSHVSGQMSGDPFGGEATMYGNTVNPRHMNSTIVQMYDWKRTSAATLKMDYAELEPDELTDKEYAFGALKAIAQNELYHSRVSDWHYLEKRAALERVKKTWRLPYLTLLFWYHLSSKFGESFRRAGAVLGVLLALVFLLAGAEARLAPLAVGVDVAAGAWGFLGGWAANFVDYLPAAKLVGKHQGAMRLLVYLSKIILTLQTALLGFALRNRFRR